MFAFGNVAGRQNTSAPSTSASYEDPPVIITLAVWMTVPAEVPATTPPELYSALLMASMAGEATLAPPAESETETDTEAE